MNFGDLASAIANVVKGIGKSVVDTAEETGVAEKAAEKGGGGGQRKNAIPNAIANNGNVLKTSKSNVLKSDESDEDEDESKDVIPTLSFPASHESSSLNSESPSQVSAEENLPAGLLETGKKGLLNKEASFDDKPAEARDPLTPTNFMDRLLLDDDAPLNPDNWPIIGSTDSEKKARKEREQYRESNPFPENALVYDNGSLQKTSDEYLGKYQDYFESKGGLQSDYKTGLDTMNDAITGGGKTVNGINVNRMMPSASMGSTFDKSEFDQGLDKMANENYDDGTMRSDSVKSKLMSGAQYKEYENLGMGGRPYDEIDDNATYNKLDEMMNYHFIPYVEDHDQYEAWTTSQLADSVTKMYNIFGDLREGTTSAKINYGDQSYDRDDFYDNAGTYFEDLDKQIGDGRIEMLDANDPNVDKDNDLPMTVWWSFPGTDVRVPSDQDLSYQWSDDGSQLYVWVPGYEDQAVVYDGLEDYEENKPEYATYRSEEGDPVHKYWKIPKLEYEQNDGTRVSLPYGDVEDMAQSMADGTADMDWGVANLAKDSGDRKGWTDMFTTGDFSDLAPNFTDLLLGSAPLFFAPTAWPMALTAAGTAAEGLDPRLYDYKTDTWRRLSDDMNGDKYLSNIVLSGTVPLTERLAGGIGGSGGLVGRPIKNALEKAGAPKTAQSAMDVLGEGAEETVASAWEDYQVNGLDNWFANPLYETDDDGNILTEYNPVTKRDEPRIKYDTTGHEMRDSNTSSSDRFGNWLDQQSDNFLAGSTLGLSTRLPNVVADVGTDISDAKEKRLIRQLEKANNLPKFKSAKHGNATVKITPEDIGTYYGKRDE